MEEPPRDIRATWGCYEGMRRAFQPLGIFCDRSFEDLNPKALTRESYEGPPSVGSSLVYQFLRLDHVGGGDDCSSKRRFKRNQRLRVVGPSV